MKKKNLFKTIQFNLSTQTKYQVVIFDSETGPYHVRLLRARDDLEAMVLHIPQSSDFTEASPSYSWHTLGESYPSAEMQSVYSAFPADWPI